MKPKQPVSSERAEAIEALKQKWIMKNQVKKSPADTPADKKQKDEPKKK